jgi:transketolase
MNLTDEKIKHLELTANSIREDIIKMLVEAGSGHTAGPLGMADIFTALFFEIAKLNPQKPDWEERDRIVLSNGHICPVLYATMAHRGFFPKEELMTLRKLGTRLQGHPHRTALPGLETTSGPLGSGLSQASGMAYGLRLDNKRNWVFCLTSDGEHDEGNTWEAVLFAGKYSLANLICFLDRNNIQIDGPTEEVMPLEDLRQKYESFGWHVIEINGHNFEEIVNAVEAGKAEEAKPTMIIAHTIPGKGVDFMEGDFKWHGMPPDLQDVAGDPKKGEQAKVALKELRTLGGKIRSEHE